MTRSRARSLGGVVGVIVAVAGGFGAAVGFYTLPNPQGLGAEGGVYARADQRAIAVWPQPCTDTCRTLRIDTGRGGSEGHNVGFGVSDGFPRADGGQDVNVFFAAHLQTCSQDGQSCEETGWESPSVPNEWLTFDPLLGSATFDGDVEGCHFHVTWTADPDGVVAPFAGYPQADTAQGAWHAETRLENGYAEVSRVAPASILMTSVDGSCEAMETSQPTNGFLSQGVRRTLADAGAGFR